MEGFIDTVKVLGLFAYFINYKIDVSICKKMILFPGYLK